MQWVQTTVYGHNENPDAQHQAAAMEMASSHVLHRQLQQGISSVVLARWLGVTQPTAWKMGHAIRELMAAGPQPPRQLTGIVELDEKYIGGKPRYQKGIKHKRGRGTAKK